MKNFRIVLAVVSVMVSCSAFAQTFFKSQNLPLGDRKTLELEKYTTHLFDLQEDSISQVYAQQITSFDGYRSIAPEELTDSVLTSDIHNVLEKAIAGEEYWWDFLWDFRELVQNKTFRAFLAKKGNACLQSLCQLYPASGKKLILKRINSVLSVMTEMTKHSYTAVPDDDEGFWYSLVKDGRAVEDFDIIHGLEGWLARRMLLDKIPLAEMRSYVLAAKEAVNGVDVTKHPEYAEEYLVNNHLQLLVTPGEVWCKFVGGKLMQDVVQIKCFEDESGTYYKVYGLSHYNDEGEEKTSFTLYNSAGIAILSGDE